MKDEASIAVIEYRKDLNEGDVEKINEWISNDFIGYFGYYPDKDYEIYRGESYRLDNIETFKEYRGKKPYWHYIDLTSNLRSPNELIVSSIVDFYLSEDKVASVLSLEVFKKESDQWKLYRQHMERYEE